MGYVALIHNRIYWLYFGKSCNLVEGEKTSMSSYIF